MATFFKANIASIIASFFDYLVTVLLVTFFHVDVVVASVAGTVCGGILNFIIGRNWVFQSKTTRVHVQATKYVIVWVGNLILNASGMYLLAKVAGIYYVIAKLIVSLIVGFGYNYVLQKRYVFKKPVEVFDNK